MAVTYCTTDDVRDTTNNEDLQDDDVISDDQLTARIEAAEVYIDSLAGYWNREEGVAQVRVFPRLEDTQYSGTEGTIPDAVKQATIAQVEFMYENMPDRDHGVVQDDLPTRESISPRARQLMHGYIRKTGRIGLPDTQDPRTL